MDPLNSDVARLPSGLMRADILPFGENNFVPDLSKFLSISVPKGTLGSERFDFVKSTSLREPSLILSILLFA